MQQLTDKVRRESVFSILACILLFLIPFSGFAQKQHGKSTLAVITTPVGQGPEARIARSMVPSAVNDQIRLHFPSDLLAARETPNNHSFMQQIEQIEQQAREAALAFDLVKAAQLRRQLADELLKSIFVLYQPSVTAQHLLQAGAASVDAGETDLALSYFRRALAVDRDIRPGAQISPQAQHTFNTALTRGPSDFRHPNDRVLLGLCQQLSVDGVLWIAVGRDDEGIVATQKLLFAENNSSKLDIRYHPGEPDVALRQWIVAEQNRIISEISLSLHQISSSNELPWFKQKWLYAVIGGVIAASVAGVGIGLAVQPQKTDIVVRH